MRIQILSDFHLEFHRDGGIGFLDQLPVEADTLVVAGDLTTEKQLLEIFEYHLCRRWKDVIYVVGNHELYGSSFQSVRATLGSASMRNLHVLDNDILPLNGCRFVGTTLWFRETEVTRTRQEALADFKAIEGFEEHVYEENQKAVEFLRLLEPGDVVVTHHIPAMRGFPARYRGSPINDFWWCDMEELILERRPAFWIYGHTHATVDTYVDVTRLVCNPVGYPHEVTGYVADLVIDG